jgi:hypothetical protein
MVKVRFSPPIAPPRPKPLGGPVIAPSLQRPVRADGSLMLGRRASGRGEVSLTKQGELVLDGRKGPAALLEVSRLVENGVQVVSRLPEEHRAALIGHLHRVIEQAQAGKQTAQAAQVRSAAVAVLLSVAGEGDEVLRKTLEGVKREETSPAAGDARIT